MTDMQVSSGRIMARKDDREHSGHGAKREVAGPNRLVRGLLIAAGTICVGLGVLGILLPLLPTTPFLLLAAACYGSSSRRFYRWLLNNRWFGNYLRDYREKKGIPLKVKLSAIFLLWATILFAALFVVDTLLVRAVLMVTAGMVTIHVLRIRTLRPGGGEK